MLSVADDGDHKCVVEMYRSLPMARMEKLNTNLENVDPYMCQMHFRSSVNIVAFCVYLL